MSLGEMWARPNSASGICVGIRQWGLRTNAHVRDNLDA